MTVPRTYPLPAPDNDPRFTFGLLLDVADVLARRGYPMVTGLDLVELRQTLFRFLYLADDTEPTDVKPVTGEVC
ncbi:hypothetical protein [Amycolatopsis sp. H20-H5]|uniref:hypothetical protein n=1 Tax=Amycolatopsis sp. H20-H5 TaxID=3046309 RepID=UPI002DBC5083|nr:hypothetical protein [Amycolatopsis sp. H20-H5]MEC3974592.1 hypothetical protein [Amycolatopsis sp. H20-H5]